MKVTQILLTAALLAASSIAIAGHGDVGAALLVPGCLHAADPQVGQVGIDEMPRGAAVDCHLDVAVVGTDVEYVGVDRRFTDRGDVSVGRDSVVARNHAVWW